MHLSLHSSFPVMSKNLSMLKEKARLCFHCYKPLHAKGVKCIDNGIISCTWCFRLNVFTRKCNCTRPNMPQPLQVLRLIGNKDDSKWYVDLRLYEEVFPAFLNTSIKSGRVSSTFATWWQSVKGESVYLDAYTIVIETVRKGCLLQIPCSIVESPDDHIELGREFMQAVGYKFTLEGMTIDSETSPILHHPYEMEYVYNIPARGRDLRTYLNNKKFFLKKGRTLKPCFKQPITSNMKVTIKRLNNSRIVRN